MKIANKEKQIQSNRDNPKQKNQSTMNKSTKLVAQQPNTIRTTQTFSKFQAKQLKNNLPTTYKNVDTTFLTENLHSYKQNELRSSQAMSKQNVSYAKNHTTVFDSKQISFTASHQFDKQQKNNSKENQNILSQSIGGLMRIKTPQLTAQNLVASTVKRTSICQYIQSKQLKSSKSAEFLRPKDSQFQTPTFQNINMIKIIQKDRSSSKLQKMKLRDYLFMTNISSEVAANKKRVQRSNSKSNVEPVRRQLKNCLSSQNLLLKYSHTSSKYNITNGEMAAILSRQILQEIVRLKNKVDKVQSWFTSSPKSQIKQVGPFYLVRRDIKNMNESFDDIMKKLISSYPQFQNADNLKEMAQSVALSKVVNNNVKFTEI